jgi:hypothetical protein
MTSPLSRRTLLRGAGAALALPFLEAMLPRRAFAQVNVPRRFIAYYVPCGIHMAAFTPRGTGTDYALTPILAPLEPVRASVNVLTGLANLPARPDGAGDHAAGTGSFLTARHVYKTEGANIQNGISLDQRIAKVVGEGTRLSSLVLGTEGGSSVGGCDSGYSCAYSRNISWVGERTPAGQEVSPRSAFDRLFAGQATGESPAAAAKRRLYKRSVLDFVLEDTRALSQKLGPSDQRKLDEYLTGVRELERRIDDPGDGPRCEVPGAPADPMDVQQAVERMTDLMVLALQCDQTRVVSFMLGNGGSNRPYPFLGVAEGHHELSHHQGNPTNHEKLTLIDTWEVEQLSRLLQKLAAIPEGDGTLLDASLVFWSSEIEDGDAHRHTNLPVILAGGCGGALPTGRHLEFPDAPPLARLFVSCLNLMGVPDATFGDDGDGPLSGLV